MPRGEEWRAEAKLKILIRHLVVSFPQASILSRQVGDRYHVFVMVPYDGGPEKLIQVERSMLADRQTTMQEFRVLLENLHLPTLLQSCERYDIRLPGQAGTRLVSSDAHAELPNLTAPTNGEWPAAQVGGTVGHGHVQFSDPYVSTPATTLSALFS